MLTILLIWMLAGCQEAGNGVSTTATIPSNMRVVATIGTPAAVVIPATEITARPATPVIAIATPTVAPHAFTPLCQSAGAERGWYDRLYFRGHIYARIVAGTVWLGTPVAAPASLPAFALGGEVGRTFAPWQAANTFGAQWVAPTGTPIRTLQGIPPEAMLAIVYGPNTDLFCAVVSQEPLAQTRVVRGRVERELPVPYCEFGRCNFHTPTLDPRQAVAVTVREVWQGNLPLGGGPLTVVTLPGPVAGGQPRLAPGDEVVLFLRPQEAVEDYYPPRVSGVPPGGEAIWIAEAVGVYTMDGDSVRWPGDRATAIPLAAFRAGVEEIFVGVPPVSPRP